MIFKKLEELDKWAVSVAESNGLDMDLFLSLYIMLGEQLPFVLLALEGKSIDIPSKRRLMTPKLWEMLFIEDDEGKYKDYVKGNIISDNDNDYEVVAKERRILNHHYILVKKVED